MAKEKAVIYLDDVRSCWKIKTNDVWIDEFDSEEEATTYALRNGCKVEGC